MIDNAGKSIITGSLAAAWRVGFLIISKSQKAYSSGPVEKCALQVDSDEKRQTE
jgi:hypothetical protein